MQDYNLASAYIAALTQQPPETAVVDFRMIHDQNKGIPAHHFRSTLPEIWQSILQYQSAGYGVYVNINALDGNGRELANVAYIRAHVIDLDNLSAEVNYQRAAVWTPAPSFAVQTSPSKYHVYWTVVPYQSNQFYNDQQRKLRQLFDSDKAIVDPTRVLRLPGTLHLKASPHLVTVWSLAGYGSLIPAEQLAQSLAAVNVIDGGSGDRHDLGEPSLAAPSIEWVRFALMSLDPNTLSRQEWIAFTAAWKQASWTLADPDTLFALWSEWCARYTGNDARENLKQWNSIRSTELGWQSVLNRSPSVKAHMSFGGVQRTVPMQSDAPAPVLPLPPEALDCSGEILTDAECQTWFKDCVYVERFGEILTPSGRFMGAGNFNGTFGGKKFLIDSTGKITDEAWKAATRSTLWTVPQVDHIRFLPDRGYLEIVADELQRKGVNVYRPAVITRTHGDVTPFLKNMELMLPVESDRHSFFAYLAHNAKWPGHKIPWAPLIQSVEGVGKGVIKRVIEHCVGSPYFYSPSARELIESGSKFNAWMRNKLFILVDEIRVDERRDMIEVLKPMISEKRIEIQGKGQDQDQEDNYSNWAFFSNHKNAIPVDENGRRFAIFYSAIQSKADLTVRGMNDAYFNSLYDWLDRGGTGNIAQWLYGYPIERGGLPMRAPETSSTPEAHRVSRTPQEQSILNAVADGVQGFRGGWIGSAAVSKRFKALGVRMPSEQSLTAILERLGYHHIGRAGRSYFNEDSEMRSELFAIDPRANAAQYGGAQGYE